jgi:integrase/recombinase XerC
MTTDHAGAPGQVEIDAARLLLARLGLSPNDLLCNAPSRAPAPTFVEYVSVGSAAVSDGTRRAYGSYRRAYGSYWNRLVEQWGARRLGEPTPSEIERLVGYVRTHAVVRRNARGGRSAAEHRCRAGMCVPGPVGESVAVLGRVVTVIDEFLDAIAWPG